MARNKYIVPTLLTALAGYGLYKLSTIKNAANTLRYTLGGVKISYKDFRLLLSIDLIITNTSNQVLRFKQFSGKLWADSNFLGFVDIPNATTIRAKADTTVNLSTVIPASAVVDVLFGNLLKLKLPTKGILRGTAVIGSINIPIDETFDFNTPTPVKTTTKK